MQGNGSIDDQVMKDNQEDRDEGESMDPKESRDEDPMESQTGKKYTLKTTKGKKMAKMFASFCCLSKSNANTIVVHFGVSMLDNWLTLWKALKVYIHLVAEHTCPDDTKHCPHHNTTGSIVPMGLQLLLLDLLAPRCIPAGDAMHIPMIYFLKNKHFDLIHLQMEYEEHGKLSLKSIS